MLYEITANEVTAIPEAKGVIRRVIQNVTAVDVWLTTNPADTSSDAVDGGLLIAGGSSASFTADGEGAGQAVYVTATATAGVRVMDWGKVL